MAKDDKEQETGQATDSGDDDRGRFVDSDDFGLDAGSDDAVTDSDDDVLPPLSRAGGSGRDNPDPGYAAFADDFDDPLADWPGPDPSLVSGGAPSGSPAEGDDTESPPAAEDQSREYSPAARAASRTVAPEDADESPAALGEPGFPDDEPDSDLSTADTADSDEEPLAADTDDDGVADSDSALDWDDDGDWEATTDSAVASDAPGTETTDARAAPGTGEPPRTPKVQTGPLPTARVTAEDARIDDRRAPLSGAGLDALVPDMDEEDDFVDEFLNDLDPPEPVDAPAALPDDLAEGESGEELPRGTVATAYAAEVTGGDHASGGGAEVAGSGDVTEMAAREQVFESGADEETPATRFPIAMIAVVVLALVLLAIGGYGVVEQRKSLEAEIRELQARLATAMTPEDSEAARAAQRRLTEQSDALTAEVQALEAENAELAARIEAMEREIADRENAAAEAEAARKAAEAEAARKAAARKEAAAKPEASATRASSAASGGEWFVNFGSYARRDIADNWARRLKVSAGSVVVQTAEAGGRTLYRVRVVGLADRDAAERVATGLEREFDLPRLWVGRN